MYYCKKILTIILLIVSFGLSAQVDYESIQVKSGYTGGWGTQRAKLVNLIPNYTPVTDGRSDFTRYGTFKHLRTDSTGYFYAKKLDGRWWMIDPNGYAGINIAATSFTTSSIQNDYDITRRIGFNGTGNFLSSESQTKSGYNLQNFSTFSFTRRLNFFLNYKNDRKNYYSTPSAVQGSVDHVLVLDPQFVTYCDNLAKTSVLPYATERDLLGYFTDNEINFNQDQLQNFVTDLSLGDPCRDSALVWAAAHGLSEADCTTYSTKVTEALKQEFATYLADRYYKIVSEAIRKYDPNHMVLGSRLHGRPRAILGVVAASQKYMDVTSVNFYDKWSPAEQIATTNWTADKPCIVGEFYIKDINVFTTTQSGAGWYVNSQASRGKFYQNTCLDLLKNKCYIGWHYFRYQDDTDSNKGIVNNSGVEYTGMTSFMDELNEQIYSLCDFYDGVNRRPKLTTKTETVVASEDTYLIPGATNTSNYGTAQELEVRYNSTEANRREAYLKFDLSAVKSQLPYLKDAQLELSCTATDATARYVFASGINDTNWQENTLTGELRNPNADWKNGYNRLAFQKSVIALGKLYFDVTTWIYEQSNGIVSFKIHDLNSTTTSIKIASKENSIVDSRPKLKLTFWDNSTGILTTNGNKEKQYEPYPNPAKGHFSVKGDDMSQIELLSLKGQKILSVNTNNIDVSDLRNGIYLLKVKNNAGSYYYSKVIVQN
ncbi:MAG: DUF7594 domain-containing protein [Paludibacter sp.]